MSRFLQLTSQSISDSVTQMNALAFFSFLRKKFKVRKCSLKAPNKMSERWCITMEKEKIHQNWSWMQNQSRGRQKGTCLYASRIEGLTVEHMAPPGWCYRWRNSIYYSELITDTRYTSTFLLGVASRITGSSIVLLNCFTQCNTLWFLEANKCLRTKFSILHKHKVHLHGLAGNMHAPGD